MSPDAQMAELFCEPVSGVFLIQGAEGPQRLRKVAEGLGIAVRELDGARVRTLDELLRLIGQVLEFPRSYGCNLDALIEYLRDHEFKHRGPLVLVVDRAEMVLMQERLRVREEWLFLLNQVTLGIEVSGVRHLEDPYHPFWVALCYRQKPDLEWLRKGVPSIRLLGFAE